jgi:hypothetical protein
MSTLAGELLAGYRALNVARKQMLADEAERLRAENVRGMKTGEEDERAGAAMLALAMMENDEALEMLARGHEDPERLAAAVARVAVTVLAFTARRPHQANLFELEQAYREALRLAMDGAGKV